ncbi:uncharacterized protein LOC122571554 isoform X1 [Bombus pyrosoma]|uniref:uncharacterized protein LOC122571554 isoform X1 n=1 Tax=Bombus pyrosoma TaxID=396416 RepID=UPI001CB8E5F3|nr:uncharacterized protein LOC122571554 isoform X1 [Bombus pyrosoma]
MYRRILVLIVSLAFVLTARADKNVRCYVCTSLTHPNCETDPKAHNLELDECTLNHMVDWKLKIQQHKALEWAASIFDVDNLDPEPVALMACAKMIFKDKYQNITMRSCQTAKTETFDPCKSINTMIPNDKKLEFCELCTEDACNSSITMSPIISFTLLSALGAVVLGCFYNSA